MTMKIYEKRKSMEPVHSHVMLSWSSIVTIAKTPKKAETRFLNFNVLSSKNQFLMSILWTLHCHTPRKYEAKKTKEKKWEKKKIWIEKRPS